MKKIIEKIDDTFLGVIVSLILAVMVNLLTSYGVHWSLSSSDLSIFLHVVAILLMLAAIRYKLLFNKRCEQFRTSPRREDKEIGQEDVVGNVYKKRFYITLSMSMVFFIAALMMAILHINSIKSDEEMNRANVQQKDKVVINLLNKIDSLLEKQNNQITVLEDSLKNKNNHP